MSGINYDLTKIRGFAFDVDGVLSPSVIPHKLEIFPKWMEDNGLETDEVIYFGDDIPDLKCMRIAGLPCAPRDAAWEARETALYVSRFDGGYGCVRDVVEQVLKAKGEWLSDAHAFGW